MRLFSPIHSLRDQRGQMFAGYIVAIMVIMLLALSVVQKITAQRKAGMREYFREQAVNVAKAGFEDGTSFFRRQPGGVNLASTSYNPSSNAPVTTSAWPLWPDAAFMPGLMDTDYYAQIVTNTAYGSNAQALTSAAGIVRTIPLLYYGTSATAATTGSRVWGRYVLRRQNSRNWSPGTNTYAAFSDPEAVHDLSAQRSSSALGSGTVWSIFSHGYVFTSPSDLTLTSQFVGNNFLNAPVATYKGQRLLQASASVYGELSRMNFNLPPAAVYLPDASWVTVNAKGYLDGTGGKHIACSTGTFSLGGGKINPSTIGIFTSAVPSVGVVFPGQNTNSLQTKAQQNGAMGGMEIFPKGSDTNFTTEVSTTKFLYCTLTAGARFYDSTTDNTKPMLTGVGLAYFAGSITLDAGSGSSWAGIVYVNGSAYINGPADISGILVATGKVTIGNGGSYTGIVEYNGDAIATAEQLLEQFSIVESSVVVTSQ